MPARDWSLQKVLKRHVRQAAKIWKEHGHLNFKDSISYDVLIDGKPYPPKAISSCAHELATGLAIEPHEFSGAKDGRWHRRLEALGFPIVEKRPQVDFDAEVAAALRMTASKRNRMLEQTPATPPVHKVSQVYRYVRSPYVVAERLCRANGRCEKCKKPAPFKRKRNGTPYLEVHHTKPLSKGGLDTVENTMAVCPNCHCELHDRLGLDITND